MNKYLDSWLDVQSKKLDEKEKKTGIDCITGKRIKKEKRKAWIKVMNNSRSVKE